MRKIRWRTKNINAKDGIIRIAPISLTGIALGTGCKRGKYRSGIIFAGVIDEFANVWLFSLPNISGSIDRNIL